MTNLGEIKLMLVGGGPRYFEYASPNVGWSLTVVRTAFPKGAPDRIEILVRVVDDEEKLFEKE